MLEGKLEDSEELQKQNKAFFLLRNPGQTYMVTLLINLGLKGGTQSRKRLG